MDFGLLKQLFDQGSTGIGLSIILWMETYWRERRNQRKEATINDYLEWLRRQNHGELKDEVHDLLERLTQQSQESEEHRSYLALLLDQMSLLVPSLDKVAQTVNRTETKVDELKAVLEQFRNDAFGRPDLIGGLPQGRDTEGKGRIHISSAVIEAISRGIGGSGVQSFLKYDLAMQEGTLIANWHVGEESPRFMLVDYVGDIFKNRISVIVNEDASITLRFFDGNGKAIRLSSKSLSAKECLSICVTWNTQLVRLWINGRIVGEGPLSAPFEYLGPVLFKGIDIEGSLSADSAAFNQEPPGILFRREGRGLGAQLSSVMLYQRELPAGAIKELWQNPFAMCNFLSGEPALKQINESIAEGGTSPGLLTSRAKVLIELERFEQAERDASQAIGMGHSGVESYLTRAFLLEKRNKPREALQDLNVAISNFSKSWIAYVARASFFLECCDETLKNPWAAIMDARKACDLSDGHRDTLLILASAYASVGDFRRAAECQEEALGLLMTHQSPTVEADVHLASQRLAEYRTKANE